MDNNWQKKTRTDQRWPQCTCVPKWVCDCVWLTPTLWSTSESVVWGRWCGLTGYQWWPLQWNSPCSPLQLLRPSERAPPPPLYGHCHLAETGSSTQDVTVKQQFSVDNIWHFPIGMRWLSYTDSIRSNKKCLEAWIESEYIMVGMRICMPRLWPTSYIPI